MKTFFLLSLITISSYAVEIKFIGPCDENFIMRTEVTEEYSNVGELTIGTLQKFAIPYLGVPEGLSSAFGTPVGKEAMETVSEDEIRAYGWCFSVDGVAPELYPHEIPITSETKSITWHFGYARMYKGQWVTQCSPAWKIKPRFLCEAEESED